MSAIKVMTDDFDDTQTDHHKCLFSVKKVIIELNQRDGRAGPIGGDRNLMWWRNKRLNQLTVLVIGNYDLQRNGRPRVQVLQQGSYSFQQMCLIMGETPRRYATGEKPRKAEGIKDAEEAGSFFSYAPSTNHAFLCSVSSFPY